METSSGQPPRRRPSSLAAVPCQPLSSVSESTLQNLSVFKDVCTRIRSSLLAGRNEVISPATLSRELIKDAAAGRGDTATTSSHVGNGIVTGETSDTSAVEAGPVEACPFLEPADGWSIEYGGAWCEHCGRDALCVCTNTNPSYQLRPLAEAAYNEFFFEKSHTNYFQDDPDIGPCVVSIKKEDISLDSFRILVRSSEHYLHGLLAASMLFEGDKNLLGSPDNIEDVLKGVGRVMGVSGFRRVHSPNLEKDLLHMDETFVKAHHKVGVLQVREGQRNEEDIFCNRHEPGCPFDEFLNVLGGRVPLHGFKGFLGGLDNERDLTGELSVYTKFEELEIMFHVSTLLPFSPKDSQQVNKKRHIGNDIVCVVFLDSESTTFNPSWIRSHFIHCYVVIQYVKGSNGHPLYKVGVAHRTNVPSFQPSLKESCVFSHSHTFQQMLLTKIVNGERASYHAPRFLKLTNRSRGQLLTEITSTFCDESIKQGKNPRKILKRSNWLPIGASRPPSPPLDPVHEKYTNTDKLAEDFSIALRGCELADVMFIVGEDRIPLYGVKAILACRSRVFRTMFKEVKPSSSGIGRLSSPLLRRRVPTVNHQYMSPPNTRRTRILGIGRLKKKMSVPDNISSKVESDSTSSGGVGATPSFADDPRNTQIKEQYVVEDFSETVFMELLNYAMLGACSIKPANVVGLACAAEHYEIMALREACHEQLPKCLSVTSVCEILSQLEKHLAFSAAKTMIVQSLEFVDNNAHELLESERFLTLSENMVHLVLRRDTNVTEILKVKAAFAWGRVNAKPRGPDFKTLVTPLVKHVRLHQINPKDLVEVLVPSGIFDIDKVMAALAYQVDPESVEPDDYSMFRPRKKSNNVLSSH